MAKYLPGVDLARSYERRWLRRDLIAGLTVGAMLVPQAMAYANLAGLPAVSGLYAAVLPMFVYALLGSSRQLMVGPESTTAIMTAAAVAPLAAGDPALYAVLAAAARSSLGSSASPPDWPGWGSWPTCSPCRPSWGTSPGSVS